MKDAILVIVLGITGFLLLLLFLNSDVPAEALFQLAFGWVVFLVRELPGRRVNWTDTITALVCMAGLGAGLHLFLRWLQRETNPILRWRLRWTVQFLALILLAFLA